MLAVGGVGAFYYYYEMPTRAPRWRRAQRSSTSLQARHRKGPRDREEAAGVPRAGRPTSKARLDSLRAVLPEEKDAADLLRRMQTVATQSNLTIKSFKPAPVVTKQLHAEWPIALELDGTYHNLAIFFDRVGKFTRIVNISGARREGQGQARRRTRRSPRRCVATTFVLLDKPAAAPAEARKPAPRRPRAKKASMSHASARSSSPSLLAGLPAAVRRRRRQPRAGDARTGAAPAPAAGAASAAAAPRRRRPTPISPTAGAIRS